MVEIPAGMVPWPGGDSAPADWDKREVLWERYDGRTLLSWVSEGGRQWSHDNWPKIIAYTPRPSPTQTGGSGGERPGYAAGIIHEPGTDPDEDREAEALDVLRATEADCGCRIPQPFNEVALYAIGNALTGIYTRTATPNPIEPRAGVGREDLAEIDRISWLLVETWKRVDPNSGVAKHPVSYMANFADMARAVIADRNAEKSA